MDPHEIETWIERVEAGNIYVNRSMTGAIVQRQPFGGWKRSVVGPTVKAGGPHYVASLRNWHHAPFESDRFDAWVRDVGDAVTDPSGLAAEANDYRMRRLPGGVAVRIGTDATTAEVEDHPRRGGRDATRLVDLRRRLTSPKQTSSAGCPRRGSTGSESWAG